MKNNSGKNPFQKYMGRRQGDIFDNPLTRRGVKYWLERVLGYYGDKGGGVDIEIIEGQLGLCAKTADYIYSDFTPLTTAYVAGSRPVLEKIVKKELKKGMSKRQQVLQLMRFCRDARDQGVKVDIDGGSEEELLKRGGGMCNEISRVFICLCQIAGIPARLYSAHITGHMMAEVYADGKWGFIDPYFGLAPVLDNNQPASAWELLQDPEVLERQPSSVWKDLRPPKIVFGKHDRDERNLMYAMAKFRDCYFNSQEAAVIGNYYVWEHDRYTYPWHQTADDPERLREARRQEALNQKAMNWPDYYFCSLLFKETLGPRRK